MKQCKQCGMLLNDEAFRKTKTRSKGLYKNLSQGTKTICRSCESLDVRARRAMNEGNEEVCGQLREHYMKLLRAGHPPVTAAAKRILGNAYIDAAAQVRSVTSNASLKLTDSYDTEVLDHAYKVKNRLYASVDEADKCHRELESRLREADLYEEITDLLDEWYMSE